MDKCSDRWTAVHKMEKLRARLLARFFEEPEREFYIRELAKLLKKSPTTISKYLVSLKKEGLLSSSRKFGYLFYRANQSRKLIDLKRAHNIRLLRESGLLEYLNDAFNYPKAIVLFGSFARAENGPQSDINLLVVSPSKKRPDLKKFERKLGHEIQIFIHSEKELALMKNKELLNNFINGIVLEGYMEVIK